MPKSKLLDYLNLLDKDAAAREAFARDPQAAMTAYGLDAAEQQALLSGNQADIAKLVGVDVAALPLPQIGQTDYKPN